MEKLIKTWRFDHTVYQDDFNMGTFSHSLSLFKEPASEENYPTQIFKVIWEIPALQEETTAQILTIDMVIHDHRNLFSIPNEVLEYLYSFGFCLDNSIDPNCNFIQQNYEMNMILNPDFEEKEGYY